MSWNGLGYFCYRILIPIVVCSVFAQCLMKRQPLLSSFLIKSRLFTLVAILHDVALQEYCHLSILYKYLVNFPAILLWKFLASCSLDNRLNTLLHQSLLTPKYSMLVRAIAILLKFSIHLLDCYQTFAKASFL